MVPLKKGVNQNKLSSIDNHTLCKTHHFLEPILLSAGTTIPTPIRYTGTTKVIQRNTQLTPKREATTMATLDDTNEPMVVDDEEVPPDMSLMDITDGDNGRGIPAALFIDDITAFSESFTPHAQAELLIGAYTQLHTKYKSSEASLQNKRTLFYCLNVFVCCVDWLSWLCVCWEDFLFQM